jgi:hypothetical protein
MAMPEVSDSRVDTADVLAIDAAVARSTGSASFGVTRGGFVPKPFARLLAEKLALARALLGDDLDLTSGSVVRKLLEVSSLEDARTWAAMAAIYDNMFVASATGEALTRLGEELQLPRPFLEAKGRVRLVLQGALPDGVAELRIARGARMLTSGGHHVAAEETLVLSPASPQRDVAVAAFYPGPEHNLVPSNATQKIDRFNPLDPSLAGLLAAEAAAGATLVKIEHTDPLTGGELQWPDARYRQLLLQAPRSVWTVDAIRIAVSLVPGVRQVKIKDGFGGLDIHQSIFGNFNFIERVFSSERDLGSPYYFTVLVAPTPAAIFEGPDGLRTSIESAIEDLRPIGIFPRVEKADEVGVGVEAKLVVSGIPLPSGSKATVNASEAAKALKARLLVRLRQYVDSLAFGEPVRAAEVVWAFMNEPGVADVRDVKLLRYPPGFDGIDFAATTSLQAVQKLGCGENLNLQVNQVAVFVDDPANLEVV